VDDASTDQTPEILKVLHQKDERVKMIRFARNCGSHAALSAGLHHCKGESAIVLAADLQDPPELIGRLLEAWQQGAKIVWGARSKREGETASTTFLSKTYYRTMNWLTSVKMPPSGADVFLADRSVIEAFKQVTEKHTSIFMTLAWLGFRQTTIYYVKQARFSGRSKWTVRKKIKLTIDSLLAFSDVFVRYMSFLGFFTAVLGFIYAAHVLWTFIHGSPVEGWSSLMVAILVIGGVQMMMCGVLGEYLWRTFDESRRRPRYIIEYKIE
ncbi:MAG: glycosyltransferase, partial [Omnitrophica WOR_2 bacterium GWC2_45_7]